MFERGGGIRACRTQARHSDIQTCACSPGVSGDERLSPRPGVAPSMTGKWGEINTQYCVCQLTLSIAWGAEE